MFKNTLAKKQKGGDVQKVRRIKEEGFMWAITRTSTTEEIWLRKIIAQARKEGKNEE